VRRFSVLIVSTLLAVSGQNVFSADEEEFIEEVVVTGSYLKRSAADSPSPLSVVTSADIEDLGASDVAEIVQALPWSSGSQSRASTFQGEGADGRSSINLRNLGHGATLPLVNGKRQVASWFNPRGNASVNVNGLIPNIALERVEIVKDGSSALYGSDAIAGVVNFITKKDFEGFDFNYQFTTDDETGQGDANTAGLIFGVQGARGGIVASASFLNRDEINVDDRFERFGGSTISSTGQPGRLIPLPGQTIIWAANGLRPGEEVDRTIDNPGLVFNNPAGFPVAQSNLPRSFDGSSFGQADPACEASAALEQGGPVGTFGFGSENERCAYDFGSFFALQAEEQLRKIHVTGHYDISESFEAYFEFAANDSEFDRLNSLNPNAPALTIPIDHPGNIEDARRRGIEPILYSNVTRLVGGTRNTPRNLRPLDTFTDTKRSDQRLSIGGVYDFTIGDRSWTVDASYTASDHDSATSQVQDTLSNEFELALNGLGGPECNPITGTPGEGNLAFAASGGDFDAGNCYYFNPFGSSLLLEDGTPQTDLALRNPDELFEFLAGRITNDSNFRQRVIDIVAAGDLADTKAGPIGLALGFQRRRDSAEVVFDAAANTNNLDFAFGAQDWSGDLTTTAVFAELGIPILPNLQVNIAARYEDFDEINEDTFDPKITILYQPFESLSLRASGGTSFRVPSLQQLFGTITTVADQPDVVGGQAFKPSISVGNPNLAPEESDTFNVGISWIPQEGFLQGLQIDVDYYNYSYEDIITRENSRNLLINDNNALQAFADANVGGSCATEAACFVDAVAAGVGNRDQIIRNPQGVLLRILPEFANANSADISGIDFTSSYTFDTGFGTWRAGIQAAWVAEYEVVTDAQTFDSVGSYNDLNPVARPLPEFKINGTLGWTMNNHRAFLIVKYVDSLTSDRSAGAQAFFRAGLNLVGNNDLADDLFDDEIESFTTADLQYTYSFGERGFLTDANITLGIQNVTNEEPPVIALTTAYDGTLHDPRGRIFSIRVGGSL